MDAKPDKSLVIPTEIKDFQALLDNTNQTYNKAQGVGMGEIASGDFYIAYSSWQTLLIQQKNLPIYGRKQLTLIKGC